MPPVEYELKPVLRITADAIGQPGERVFYLQGRSEDFLLTLLIEKQQIQSLAIGIEQFLQDLEKRFPDLSKASSEYSESQMELEQPIDPEFRVGQLGLGYDEEVDMLVLVAREIQADDEDEDNKAVARFWCTRSQLWAMCQWGLELASRGRPICGNCGHPIDPGGHFCAKRNGHKH
ncbi:MAG: DUF3090 domain-containing protein [Chloroflexi bacterium]|nr:DUF3090 domain-containing protein [Chloroflexota bacterium]